MENSLIRNTKKFFFEFIIVTLGILTAFNINKWDENNKLKAEETDAYKSLKDDLNSDLYVLNYYRQFHIQAKNYLEPLLEKDFAHVDSLEYYLHVAFNLQEGNATYINLKSSGKLGILKNRKIKSQVVLYYETYYQGLENMGETHSNLVFDKIDPYILNNFKFEADTNDIRKNLKDDKLLKLISYQYALLESNLGVFDKCENLINRILENIDLELGIEAEEPTASADTLPTDTVATEDVPD